MEISLNGIFEPQLVMTVRLPHLNCLHAQPSNGVRMARPGFLLPSMVSGTELWIGPDMSVFGIGQGFLVNNSHCPNSAFATNGIGSCKYDEGRIGGFLHIVMPNVPWWGDWVLSGGYRKPLLTNGGPDGYYAQIGWYAPFR